VKTCGKPTESDRRSQGQQIARILESEDLLASIKVNIDGRLRPIPISWDEYWSSVRGYMTGDLAIQLDELRAARATYLRRTCDYRSAITYCWAYCALLRSALDSRQRRDLRLLWSILGFECCSVRWPDCTDALAAATSTSRNPIYLLARLREPQSREDPKFLPFTTVFDPASTGPPHSTLYYHYRQFKIDRRTDASVLVYPSAQMASRVGSFECIQTMASGLSSGTDPRSRQRAKRIVELALAPFLRRRSESQECDVSQDIRILDLGGGSGSLTRSICEALSANHAKIMRGRRFSWTMVDVKFQNPRRHVMDRTFRRMLAGFRCEQTDYLAWIDRQPATPNGASFDVVLLCRLLNNASHFSIGWVDDWYQVHKLSAGALSYGDWKKGSFLPHVCLAGNIGTPTGLSASNRRIPLLNGSSFWQLSLSDYYRGLHLLTTGVDSTGGAGAIYFPIRRFNDSSLMLSSGRSALDNLCWMADLCVIEDVDLQAGVLLRHLESHRLGALAASDVTDRARMRSASLLCVCRREKSTLLPGRRIW
jgi:hypothetical protein